MLKGCRVCVICDSSSFHSLIFKLNTLCLFINMIAHTLNMCAPYILCTFDNIFGILNLDIIMSTPPLECLHYLCLCNLQFKLIPFLYIQTLHNDCSPIEDVHRRRRSRAEFGLVPLKITFNHRCEGITFVTL